VPLTGVMNYVFLHLFLKEMDDISEKT